VSDACRTEALYGPALFSFSNEVASENGFPDKPSKVGIAREYVDSLMATEDKKLNKGDAKRAIKLVGAIKELTGCPEIKSPESSILG